MTAQFHIALQPGMILIALINRFFITPRIKSGFAVAARQLRYTTVGELALGLGALVLVNVFSTFDPG